MKWRGIIFFTLLFLSTSCMKDNSIKDKANIIDSLQTDKAQYSPGETVTFSLNIENTQNEARASIIYKHLNETIEIDEVKLNSQSRAWSWSPPETDGKGYLAIVTVKSGNTYDTETIAVDVSSSWSTFPRYGFLSDFSSKSNDEIHEVMHTLNRFHINGLQFYDWMYKHHQPLKQAEENWLDVSNRQVSTSTVKSYIATADTYNMKTMAYNLLYGAFKEAEQDGVQTEWRLFKDKSQNKHDVHRLPEQWRSDVFLVNPHKEAWQDYLIQRQLHAINTLGFDGWHIDQLGDRGDVYNFAGEHVNLKDSFTPFLRNVTSTKDIPLVMNAVNQYGQKQIADASVDFLYTEVWAPNTHYADLKRIIDENNSYSHHQLNSVLAAYMNYNLSDQKGSFNVPGILLTNSVIFASGGAHIELGEHLLSKEYFPHNNLKMNTDLNEELINYYDFLTAYENVLRDELKPSTIEISTHDWVPLSADAAQGKVWTFAKQKDNKKILHLINFFDAKHMNWRDTEGTQAEPKIRDAFEIQIKESLKVKNIWIASPDFNNGQPQELSFTQTDSEVNFTIPHLKYWDMIVIEYL